MHDYHGETFWHLDEISLEIFVLLQHCLYQTLSVYIFSIILRNRTGAQNYRN